MAGHTSNADETREFVHRLSKVIAGVLDEEDFRHAEYIGRETDMKTWGESCQLLETQNKLRRDRFLIHEFRENLTNFFAGQLLDKFIEKNFPSANWDDKEFLKQEIKEGIEGCSRYARESIEPRNPLELAENYIQRIVKEGLRGVRKRRRASKHYWQRSFRHGWTVVKNIAALLIALVILDAATTKFETFVSALLILIYLRLVLFSYGWAVQIGQSFLALGVEFRRLRRLMGDMETQDEKELVKEGRMQARVEVADFYITVGFSSILFLIIVARLLRYMLSG